MGRAIGIDLGTTNSCVAFLDGTQAVVIPNSEGSRTTPSVVAVTASGERLVGQIAKRQALTNPENTISSVKRLVGRKLADPQVKQHLASCSYKVVAAQNGDCRVVLDGKPLSPAEISAMVLAEMRRIAEDYLGEQVTEAVVTVPAYFDDAQRQATKDAGRIAGLNVLRILNEPTAAALAYGAERTRTERIAIYDLGGGTFDISILELHGGVFEVRATNGDTYLGGEDFDRRLIDWLAGGFRDQHGIDLRHNKLALQRLKEAAERAKMELSTSLSTEVNLPFIVADATGPKHLIAEVTRQRLESLVEDLVQRTLAPCRLALADAGLQPHDIDQVILVGGQTRMPRVQAAVEGFFGRKPNKKVNPDEVVAVGAALQAGIVLGNVESVLLLDVTPLSLGVETAGGVFTPIIPRNTSIPTRRAEIFSTAVDNQSFVEVHVLQGERQMAEGNKSLAKFQLLGIPPAPRGVPQIEVEFDINADGLVNVAARDLGTGREQKVRVVPTSGLTEPEIQRIIGEAEAAQEADAERRKRADLVNQLEGLIYTTDRSLAEYGHMLVPDERAAIVQELASARVAVSRGTVDEVNAVWSRLERAAQRIGEVMYAAVAGSMEDASLLGQAGPPGEGDPPQRK